MTKQNKKFTVKIPEKISCLYDKNREIVVLKNKKNTVILKTKVYIVLNKKSNEIKVTNTSLQSISNNNKKMLKAVQGLTVAELKQALFELTEIFYKKLKFVGVGYRAIGFNKLTLKYFFLKLGLSHKLYLNSTNNFCTIVCLKFTRMYIYGVSYSQICQISAYIRANKIPEPYKGKGILYDNEKIKLKEGKKV